MLLATGNISALPIDFFKIVNMLFTGAHGDAKRESFFRSAVEIRDHLGYPVIMEGFESQCDEELIPSLGCRYAQGYIYGHPSRSGNLADLMSALQPAQLRRGTPAPANHSHEHSPRPMLLCN